MYPCNTSATLRELCTANWKTRLFLQYLDAVCADIDTAKEKIGVSKWKQVRERLGNIGKKASAAERNARLKQFEKAIKQRRKEYKAELPTGIEKTARVDGGIFLRILTGTNNFKSADDAEVRARKISMSDVQQNSWSLAEKRGKIRQHEFTRKCEEQDGYGKQNEVGGIAYIVPQSEELKNTRI